MIEFNEDGSLKLPGKAGEQQRKKEKMMSKDRCINLKRDLVKTTPPKKCILRITPSEGVNDLRFLDTIYNQFKKNASTPTKISKEGKNVEIEIGTDFRRCSDCQNLINRYKEFIEVIEDRGCCTFGQNRTFCYEDHFE